MFKKLIICICMILFVCISGCKPDPDILLDKDEPVEYIEEVESADVINSDQVKPETVTADSESFDHEIFVYVCGAVNVPGVYEMEKDDRIFDAVKAAGGMTEEALEGYINLAQLVEDGQMIRIPTIGEEQNLPMLPETDDAKVIDVSDNMININTASKDQLMTLTGIGESKADLIIQYREEHGGFSDVSDIMNIEGIKEGTYSKIKNDITVR